MTWNRLFLCFELLNPLHIGFLPNRHGTVVAPTRCYVPGKNMWGCITEKLTKLLFPAPKGRNFLEVGQSIFEQMKFSYFYVWNGKEILTPDFRDGLHWGEEPDSTFRAQFLGSCVSTSIGQIGGAEDASLHEIEFIRHRVESSKEQNRRVLLIGCAWVREGARTAQNRINLGEGTAFINGTDIFGDIILGGERNYGFGRLRRIEIPEDCKGILMTLYPEDPSADIVPRADQGLLSHVPYRNDVIFRGEIELIVGREYPKQMSDTGFKGAGTAVTNAGYFFSPGTRIKSCDDPMYMDSFGRFIWT